MNAYLTRVRRGRAERPTGPRRGRRAVPHLRELLAETLTPLAVYQRLAELSPVRFLFESVTGGEQVARFSFLGAGAARDPAPLPGPRSRSSATARRDRSPGAPLDALRAGSTAAIDARRCRCRSPAASSAPSASTSSAWSSGCRSGRPIPGGCRSPILGRFDDVVVFDHAQQRLLLIANEIEGERIAADGRARARPRSRRRSARDGRRCARSRLPASAAGAAARRERQPLRRRRSQRAVRRGQGAHRGRRHLPGRALAPLPLPPPTATPLALYRALRRVNPTPYMVLLELPDVRARRRLARDAGARRRAAAW